MDKVRKNLLGRTVNKTTRREENAYPDGRGAEIQTKTVQTKRGGIARAKIKTTSDATMKFDGKNKPTTTRDVRVEKIAPRKLTQKDFKEKLKTKKVADGGYAAGNYGSKKIASTLTKTTVKRQKPKKYTGR